MTSLTLQGILSEPDQPADSCLILLHGLGASGHDFEAVLPYFRHGIQHSLRCIFPHSPERAVTINQGMKMPAWYDFALDGQLRTVNQAHLEESVAAVRDIIAGQIEQGINPKRIILAGFSQGGAVAYEAALQHSTELAGVLALSTYLPNDVSQKLNDFPILAIHGEQDDVVPLKLGEDSARLLKSVGYSVDWKTYPMGHEMCLEEIEYVNQTINKLLDN
ncbi:alpha/beta hydrolase [Bermanella sp. R86510]|uniref:alpha/beta hydrolase n=1 Tax=unclassified Bermanella TaxID=2627862 RepID=UPI0037CA61D6